MFGPARFGAEYTHSTEMLPEDFIVSCVRPSGAVIRRELKLKKTDRVIPVSALNKTGTEEVLSAMEEILSANRNDPTETREGDA